MKALQTLPNRMWVLELSRIFGFWWPDDIPVATTRTVRVQYVICDVTTVLSDYIRYLNRKRTKKQ